MSDIADAVAVNASAVYRHFPGKQQLLKAVVFDGLAAIRRQLPDIDLTDPAASLPMLAEVMIANRHVGILWDREARHLPTQDQAELRAEIDGAASRLATAVAAARPELTAAAADLIAWILLALGCRPIIGFGNRWRLRGPTVNGCVGRSFGLKQI